MEKVDLLYDHYNETVKLSLDAQKKREKLFLALCILEIFNYSMLIFSNEIVLGISKYIFSKYEMTFDISVILVQSALWIIIVYILVRYFQTNIYIERQYSYIATLEEKISKELGESCFNRESGNYLDKYPKVLDVIAFFYTWCIPLLIILVNGSKIAFELIKLGNNWSVLFDSVCAFSALY